MDSLLGDYYTAISIIIVYHLFSIQRWVDKTSDLEGTAEEIRLSSPVGDIARARIKSRCERARHSFPIFQVLILFLAISALSYLAVVVAISIKNIWLPYSIGPTIVLWLIFVTATLTTWIEGMVTLRRTVARV